MRRGPQALLGALANGGERFSGMIPLSTRTDDELRHREARLEIERIDHQRALVRRSACSDQRPSRRLNGPLTLLTAMLR